jgi:hypothetical protein
MCDEHCFSNIELEWCFFLLFIFIIINKNPKKHCLVKLSYSKLGALGKWFIGGRHNLTYSMKSLIKD